MLRENLRYAILGATAILALVIHSCAGRYDVVFDPNEAGRTLIVDHWTGRVTIQHH